MGPAQRSCCFSVKSKDSNQRLAQRNLQKKNGMETSKRTLAISSAMSSYFSITVNQYGGKNGVQINGGKMSNDQLNINQSSGCQNHQDQIKSGQRNGGHPNVEQWAEEQNGDLQTNAGQMIFARDLEIEHSDYYESWDWFSDPRLTGLRLDVRVPLLLRIPARLCGPDISDPAKQLPGSLQYKLSAGDC